MTLSLEKAIDLAFSREAGLHNRDHAARATLDDAAHRHGQAPAEIPAGPLSARERQIIALLAGGASNAAIAAALYVTVNTVRTHLDRIRDKTGARSRADLTRYALLAGIEPASP
jgi:DNA-binding NarL/FixJ family response regulator